MSHVTYYRDQNTDAVNAITCNWTFADGNKGWFQFKLSPDGQSFTGTFGYGALVLLCQLSQAELCLGLITIGPPECDPHLQLSESDNRVDETGAKMPQPVQIALA